MNEQQQNFLQLLIEIDQICQKHGITYYLAGGTALGAVRSGGFLPWDDDLDLYITRENLQKLEAVIDTELMPGRALVSESRYPYYRNPIARYVDCTNTNIMLSQSFAEVPLGQHIEFLVMDPVPIDADEKLRFEQLLRVYTELLSPYFVVNRNTAALDSTFDPALYESYRERVRKEGLDSVLAELQQEIFTTEDDDSQSEFYCLRWGIDILMYRREYFGEPRMEEFEGHLFPVASKAEKVFRRAYGDTWMMVPDASAQETHNAIRNDKISYSEYVDDYRRLVDFEQARSDAQIYKDARYATLADRERLQAIEANLRATLCSIETRKHIDGAGIDLGAMVEKGQWKEILKLLDGYVNTQLSSLLRRIKVSVPVPRDVAVAALQALAATGRFVDAGKLLEIFAASSDFAGTLEAEERMVASVRELSIAVYDDRDLALAEFLARQGMQKYPHVPDFAKWGLVLNASGDMPTRERELNQMLDLWPEDPELLKALADVQLKRGKVRQALSNYEALLKGSRNGVVNREVQEILQTQEQLGATR